MKKKRQPDNPFFPFYPHRKGSDMHGIAISPCVHAFSLDIRLLCGFDVRLEQSVDMQKV